MLRRTLPILAVAAFVLSGCTDGDSAGPAPTTTGTTTTGTTGTSTPSSTTPPATSQTPRPTEAPPVTDPIDLRPVYTHPCATLTAEQQNQLGFYQFPHESTEGFHGTCRWIQESTPDIDIEYDYRLRLHARTDLLANAYDSSNTPEHDGDPLWVTFEPRQIRGLPAVVRTPNGLESRCEVIVGTGNGQGITLVGDTTRDDIALCGRLVTALELVIDALRR